MRAAVHRWRGLVPLLALACALPLPAQRLARLGLEAEPEAAGVPCAAEHSGEHGVGLRITSLEASGAARRAGLREGDVLLRLDRHVLAARDDLSDFLAAAEAGQNVRATYQRNRETRTSTFSLGRGRRASGERFGWEYVGAAGLADAMEDASFTGRRVLLGVSGSEVCGSERRFEERLLSGVVNDPRLRAASAHALRVLVRAHHAGELEERFAGCAAPGLTVLAGDGRVLGAIQLPLALADPGSEALDDAIARLAAWLGDPPSPAPPAVREYEGRRVATTMHWLGADWLLRETRESEEHVEELLDALGAEPGWTVADLGCGAGVHAIPLAQRVGPDGRVFGVEIQKPMLDLLRVRAEDAGVENVACWLGTETDTFLPEDSCDLILLVDVYHELSHPAASLASMRRALKPEGRLVLVEFREEDPQVPIKPTHKMSKAQARKELAANGFALVQEYDALPWQHVLFFAAEDAP